MELGTGLHFSQHIAGYKTGFQHIAGTGLYFSLADIMELGTGLHFSPHIAGYTGTGLDIMGVLK